MKGEVCQAYPREGASVNGGETQTLDLSLSDEPANGVSLWLLALSHAGGMGSRGVKRRGVSSGEVCRAQLLEEASMKGGAQTLDLSRSDEVERNPETLSGREREVGRRPLTCLHSLTITNGEGRSPSRGEVSFDSEMLSTLRGKISFKG